MPCPSTFFFSSMLDGGSVWCICWRILIQQIQNLQLGLGRGVLQGLTLELDSGVGDDNGITFDSTDLEEDLVALAPHGGLEGLAGVDSLGEADLDVLELGGVVVAVGVEDVLTGNTERAETVEDWDIEPTNGSHFGVNVEGVPVTRETVESSLILGGLLLNNKVGLAGGDLVGSGGGTTVSSVLLASEATGATDEHSELVDADIVALLVGGLDSDGDNAALALVEDVDDVGGRGQLAAGGEGADDLEVLLTVEKHHGVERGEDVAEGNGVHGGEGGDDTESGDGAEGLVVLVDEVEISALSTDTEVVEDDVALGVLKDLRGELERLGGLNIDLAVGRNDLRAFSRSLTDVLKVGHDALHGLGGGGGVGSAAVLKVGDLGPLIGNVLRQEGLIDGEAVATGTLPTELADETGTDLEDGASLGGVLVAEVLDQGSDHLGLQGGEHVWGKNSLGHAGGGHGGDNVAVNVVPLTLESQGLGQTDQSELGSRVVSLTCLLHMMKEKWLLVFVSMSVLKVSIGIAVGIKRG